CHACYPWRAATRRDTAANAIDLLDGLWRTADCLDLGAHSTRSGQTAWQIGPRPFQSPCRGRFIRRGAARRIRSARAGDVGPLSPSIERGVRSGRERLFNVAQNRRGARSRFRDQAEAARVLPPEMGDEGGSRARQRFGPDRARRGAKVRDPCSFAWWMRAFHACPRASDGTMFAILRAWPRLA